MVAMTTSEPGGTPARSGEDPTPLTTRELFDALPPLPGLRAEVIEGKLIVSPLGSPEHSWIAADLHDVLLPLRRRHGWRGSPGGVNVCIEGPRDSLVPDYVLAPADCPRWGTLELLSSGVLMVAEVVSPSSVHTDRHEKVKVYARGRVPVYLLIDPRPERPSVTVFSGAGDRGYGTMTEVAMGSPVLLPEPVGFELDTSALKG